MLRGAPLLVADQSPAGHDIELLPGLVDRPIFSFPFAPLEEDVRGFVKRRLFLAGQFQDRGAEPLHLFGGMTKDALGGLIPVEHTIVKIPDVDGVSRLVE